MTFLFILGIQYINYLYRYHFQKIILTYIFFLTNFKEKSLVKQQAKEGKIKIAL